MADVTEEEFESVKLLSENASVLLWITGGELFKGHRPKFSLILGLARSLMLERPSLSMPVLDIDDINNSLDVSTTNVIYVLRQAMQNSKPEFEFRQKDGNLYISRFVPDISMNKRFSQTQNAESVPTTVREAGHCELALKDTGQIDSIYFEQKPKINVDLEPHSVEVRVKAVGLNAKVRVHLKGSLIYA